ncbi:MULTISPECIES: Asp23/Gls24 family envelope stress response protein [unclassified Streptomyces]|uniref:Asp23/Gls24 family envelope stress response protein n=1 Tax=unclassified Streptomyces TaxID=2593676 RepID=UPI0006B036AC|nr:MULTISPECIES: Asp23/Gls24 family envelope stress response protein [unclassified Streptomyces]
MATELAAAPAQDTARDPARDRGATDIADRVVAKIAARAAREALGGVPKGGSKPHASVDVHRDVARVSVSLELDYPSDVARQCGAVRNRVRSQVEHLVGMEVHEVSVHVERLHSALTRDDTPRGRLS